LSECSSWSSLDDACGGAITRGTVRVSARASARSGALSSASWACCSRSRSPGPHRGSITGASWLSKRRTPSAAPICDSTSFRLSTVGSCSSACETTSTRASPSTSPTPTRAESGRRSSKALPSSGRSGPSEGRSWLHILALAAILAIAVYVIVDLEYPRLGLFQVTEFDQLLVDVKASMR
jgi:hypothetical protein